MIHVVCSTFSPCEFSGSLFLGCQSHRVSCSHWELILFLERWWSPCHTFFSLWLGLRWMFFLEHPWLNKTAGWEWKSPLMKICLNCPWVNHYGFRGMFKKKKKKCSILSFSLISNHDWLKPRSQTLNILAEFLTVATLDSLLICTDVIMRFVKFLPSTAFSSQFYRHLHIAGKSVSFHESNQ